MVLESCLNSIFSREEKSKLKTSKTNAVGTSRDRRVSSKDFFKIDNFEEFEYSVQACRAVG